jgi:hypothetical protein
MAQGGDYTRTSFFSIRHLFVCLLASNFIAPMQVPATLRADA